MDVFEGLAKASVMTCNDGPGPLIRGFTSRETLLDSAGSGHYRCPRDGVFGLTIYCLGGKNGRYWEFSSGEGWW